MSKKDQAFAPVREQAGQKASDEIPPWPPVYLTVSEAASELAVHRTAVLRLIHAGQLRSLRLGRSYRIPETEIAHSRTGEPPAASALSLAECARILRCPLTTIYGLLYHGHLTAERNGNTNGHQITVCEFQHFLRQATR